MCLYMDGWSNRATTLRGMGDAQGLPVSQVFVHAKPCQHIPTQCNHRDER